MPVTEPVTRERSQKLERYSDRHVVPVLVLEMSDERSRSRLREAGLLSIIFHLLLIMTVPSLLHYSFNKKVRVWTAQELINRDRELTYLAMPKDNQRVTNRPKSDIISDKDRVAMSRHPTVDKKTLQELRDSSMQRPGPTAPPAPAQPPQAAQAAPPSPPQASPPNQMARLQPAPAASLPNAFKSPLSAGSAIEQAARESAARRGMGGGGDIGGTGGLGNGRGTAQGNLEILSDTMGVDFGPYLERVLQDVKRNWYAIIPEVARPPLMKKGKVSIQFAILKDGSVAGMRLDGPSGDVSLDRAAWGGITGSNPFPPLPHEFGGQYLALVFHFYYNPSPSELQNLH